jgi:hypothetical protein
MRGHLRSRRGGLRASYRAYIMNLYFFRPLRRRYVTHMAAAGSRQAAPATGADSVGKRSNL